VTKNSFVNKLFGTQDTWRVWRQCS